MDSILHARALQDARAVLCPRAVRSGSEWPNGTAEERQLLWQKQQNFGLAAVQNASLSRVDRRRLWMSTRLSQCADAVQAGERQHRGSSIQASAALHRREAHHIHTRCRLRQTLLEQESLSLEARAFSPRIGPCASAARVSAGRGGDTWTGGGRGKTMAQTENSAVSAQRGRSTLPGRFRWDARPAPIAAPAGSARWAAPFWPILNWPPAPSRCPRRPRSLPRARMRAAFI